MGCKHEGGTKQCVMKAGHCVVWRKLYDDKYSKSYTDQVTIRTGRTSSESTLVGYVNELLAAADLNKRCSTVGGWAYLNPAPQTKHDVFAKTSHGWRTVQVKTAQLRKAKNGKVSMHLRDVRRHIKSEIIALVDDRNMRVCYISNNGMSLPKELPGEPTDICRGLVLLNNPEVL